jgi:hypothetical protein
MPVSASSIGSNANDNALDDAHMRLTAAIFVHGSIVKLVQDIWIVVFLSYFSPFAKPALWSAANPQAHVGGYA